MANPTIGATTPRIQYTATASQTVFTVPFEFLANADLAVYVNGTLKTLTTDYTLTGANTTGGGTLTFVTGRTAGEIVTILGNLAYSRNTNKYTKFGLLPAEVLEADFDALQVQSKQLARDGQFALRAPLTDTGTPDMALPVKSTRASKVLGFDSDGDPIASSSTVTAMDAAVTAINTIAGASSGSSASISHIASGTGATATTVQTKLRETVSVKDFGATGDGTTDDRTAIVAAIAALASAGGTLYFPPGTYVINDGITISNSNLRLLGAGTASVIQVNQTNGINTFMFNLSGSNVSFERLKLRRGTNTNAAVGGADTLIDLQNTVFNLELRSCFIEGNMTGQIVRSGYYYTEIRCKGEIASHPRNISICDNYWTDTGSRAIDIRCVQDVVISGNKFRNCGVNIPGGAKGTCVEVQSYDATATLRPSYNVTISNNVFQRWGDGAINCGGIYELSITNNVCEGSSIFGVEPLGIEENCIAVLGGQRIVIDGNTCAVTRSAGIQVRTQDITGPVYKDLYDVVISNNTLRSGTSPGGAYCETALQVYGINSGAYARNIVVSGNAIRETEISLLSYAGSSLDNVVITGNAIYGSGTTGSVYGIKVSDTGSVMTNLSITGNQIGNCAIGIYAPVALPSSTIIVSNGFGNCATAISDFASPDMITGSGFMSIGSNPATAGNLRFPNNKSIQFRNAANSANITALEVSTDNEAVLGTYFGVTPTTATVRVSSSAKLLLQQASQTISAGGTISAAGASAKVTGNGGAVTCGSTAVAAGVGSGHIFVLVGGSDTNTVTINDGGNMLLGAASRTLGLNDTLTLVYIDFQGWCEIAFSNN